VELSKFANISLLHLLGVEKRGYSRECVEKSGVSRWLPGNGRDSIKFKAQHGEISEYSISILPISLSHLKVSLHTANKTVRIYYPRRPNDTASRRLLGSFCLKEIIS